MYISVVIPTHNRANLLRRTIDSLVGQTLAAERFEIIVVDNGSTDETQKVAASFARRLSNFRSLYTAIPGLHVGRHVGLKAARGDVVVYGDDDIRAFPTWLEGVTESFEDPEVVLVGGKIQPDFEVSPPEWFASLWQDIPWGRALGYYTLLDFGDESKAISPEYVWGCNFSIRRHVLIDLGGFHPDAMPGTLIRFRGDGETAISRMIATKGLKAVYNPKASVHHLVSKERLSFDYLQKRAFSQGVSDSYTWIRHLKGAGKGGWKERLRLKRRVVQGAWENLLSRHRSGLEALLPKSYWEGFRFHQQEAKADPTLVDWICKPNYLDVPHG